MKKNNELRAGYGVSDARDYAGLGDMPRPRPGKAGAVKAGFLAVAAALLVCAGAFWLLREPDEKEALRAAAADKINNVLAGTPLAGIGDILRVSPPPPPPQVLNPSTEAGTLAGRNVKGTVVSPVDLGGQASLRSDSGQPAGAAARGSNEPQAGPGVAAGPDGVTFSQDYMPPVREDSAVRSSYLADVARWLASRYKPGPNGGSLAVTPQNLNQLCGVKLAAQAQGGRAGLLRYVFQPSMIQGLYNLYVNQFMADLDSAARKRGLNGTQNREFHLALAGRAAGAAAALEGILKVPELGMRLRGIDDIAQKAVEINAQLANAVFELDELRQARAPERQIAAAQLRVDGITARYRRAMEDHANAQRALADEIRKNAGQPMDEDYMLFMAAWAERRIAAGGQAAASLRSCAGILRDLARRCQQAGGGS